MYCIQSSLSLTCFIALKGLVLSNEEEVVGVPSFDSCHSDGDAVVVSDGSYSSVVDSEDSENEGRGWIIPDEQIDGDEEALKEYTVRFN